ncbi:hypothetical protein J2741_000877 [Methanolinea mesophila]|nr:hypothetical protein [Methanolinea mesophila]
MDTRGALGIQCDTVQADEISMIRRFVSVYSGHIKRRSHSITFKMAVFSDSTTLPIVQPMRGKI